MSAYDSGARPYDHSQSKAIIGETKPKTEISALVDLIGDIQSSLLSTKRLAEGNADRIVGPSPTEEGCESSADMDPPSGDIGVLRQAIRSLRQSANDLHSEVMRLSSV